MVFVLVFLLALVGSLDYEAPDGWEPMEPGTGMRLAQWRLAGEGGEADAEVVIFHFGAGSGGSVEANLQRWFSQFGQPDGSSTEERASVRRIDVNELQLTRADMSGTYVAPVRPGASERVRMPDYRMIATVVEGEGGPWFVRLLGPAGTVARWEASYDRFLESLGLST